MKYPSLLTEWFTALTTGIQSETFVKAALTKPTEAAGDLKSVDLRLITVKRELKLSFTYHHKTRDIVKNHTPEESLSILAKLLTDAFTSAKLFTLENDILLTRQGKQFTIAHHGATQKATLDTSHDRPKNRPLEAANKPWLQALGLTDTQGNILKSAQDKFRQINKYIEILDGLIKQMPKVAGPLRIADMGSGKGYLTFALYDHLTTTMGLKAEVTGVEYRQDLVKLCNDIAAKSNFTGLKFTQGTIADHDCTSTHIVIALHACDTATDDALAKAVRAGASLIVVAPCCHKQVRREMNKNNAAAPGRPLHSLLQYGTYADKLAEMVTDSLRAQIVAIHGYSTNLFEFISGEHTPKNVMIVATKLPQPLSEAEKSTLQTLINTTKNEFQIKTHWLETLL